MRKTGMGRAVDYFLKRKEELLECFRQPGSRIDNNLVENAIRPLKLGLKNYLFVGHPAADFWLERGPFDVRHVEGSVFLKPDSSPKAYQTAWMRVRQPLEVDELTHRALIAFGCDQVMLEPLLRRHGVAWTTEGMNYASLDHAMWWHRPARADEWLLYVQDTPTAQAGRGLTGAWVFAEDGRLVATIAQEGMLRLPSPPS